MAYWCVYVLLVGVKNYLAGALWPCSTLTVRLCCRKLRAERSVVYSPPGRKRAKNDPRYTRNAVPLSVVCEQKSYSLLLGASLRQLNVVVG
jgi:hypothetical protein